MEDSQVDAYAKIVWDYHQLHLKPIQSDAIFVLCSLDERVAEYAAKLFLEGYGKLVIFSGGMAHADDLLKARWEVPEAEHFASIAYRNGVPRNKVLIEPKAQNTGENIRYTHTLLRQKHIHPASLLLVQKPYMERRTYATFIKQWPDQATRISVTSPPIEYGDYFNEDNPKELVLNIMVGDLQRIKEYPALGFQIEQDIPKQVWDAFKQLVELGYTQHLIPSNKQQN